MIPSFVTVGPGVISGTVQAPPSKSMMQRVLAALWLRGESITINNPGYSADDRVMIQLLECAGFAFESSVSGALRAVCDSWQPVAHADFGESGLAARMCTPILALQRNAERLEASPGLRARPMDFLEGVLPKLGVQVATHGGRLPATIRGPLVPQPITIDASLSSQVLTGLLLAYAVAGAADMRIQVTSLASKPYIDLTLHVMTLMGLPIPETSDYTSFYFPSKQTSGNIPAEITIEGDWSGAAFLLVAGAIAGRATVTGLDAFSTQGDKAILTALMDAGAGLSIESGQVTVGSGPLKAFHFNATDYPDLFPPLAALACYAAGTTVIKGAGRLQHKESNRAAGIISELGKMGADISLQDDYMIIRGGARLHGATVSSHNDHRIAMMCAVAALGADARVIVEGAGAVEKSYPRFFEDLQALGAAVSIAG